MEPTPAALLPVYATAHTTSAESLARSDAPLAVPTLPGTTDTIQYTQDTTDGTELVALRKACVLLSRNRDEDDGALLLADDATPPHQPRPDNLFTHGMHVPAYGITLAPKFLQEFRAQWAACLSLSHNHVGLAHTGAQIDLLEAIWVVRAALVDVRLKKRIDGLVRMPQNPLALDSKLVTDIIQGKFISIHDLHAKHMEATGATSGPATVRDFYAFRKAYLAYQSVAVSLNPFLQDSMDRYLQLLTAIHDNHGIDITIAFDVYKRTKATGRRMAFLHDLPQEDQVHLTLLLAKPAGLVTDQRMHRDGPPAMPIPSGAAHGGNGAFKAIQQCLGLLRQGTMTAAQRRACAHYNVGPCPHRKSDDSPACSAGFIHMCLRCARTNCKLITCAEPGLCEALREEERRHEPKDKERRPEHRREERRYQPYGREKFRR